VECFHNPICFTYIGEPCKLDCMIIVKCKSCSKEFPTKKSNVERGYGKYCSISCGRRGQRTGRIVPCFICNKEVYRAPEKLARVLSKKYFCSKSCQTKWRNQEFIGPKHGNWKHGRDAYRSVLDRHKIRKICTFCKTSDTRILAVHHVDRNHLNNNVENLAWLCHNCHYLVHHDIVDKHRFLIKHAKR
jgi:hypothetical protein